MDGFFRRKQQQGADRLGVAPVGVACRTNFEEIWTSAALVVAASSIISE